MIWIMLALLFLGIAFGFVYPACAVVYYKIRYKNRITVRQILRIINY